MLALPIDQQIERIRGDLHDLRSKITFEEDIHQNQVTQLQMKQERIRQAHSRSLKFSQNNIDMYERAVKQAHQDGQAPPHIISLETNLCSVIHYLGKMHVQTKLVNEQSYDIAKTYKAGVGYHTEMAAIKEAELLKRIAETSAEMLQMKEDHVYRTSRMEWSRSVNLSAICIRDSAEKETFLQGQYVRHSRVEQQREPKVQESDPTESKTIGKCLIRGRMLVSLVTNPKRYENPTAA